MSGKAGNIIKALETLAKIKVEMSGKTDRTTALETHANMKVVISVKTGDRTKVLETLPSSKHSLKRKLR